MLAIESNTVKLQFRELPQFPGYAVRSDGTIWSKLKGRGGLGNTWHRRKHRLDKAGYPIIILFQDGKAVNLYVHRIVLETFIGPCPEGMEACHFPDRDKTNCHLNNLRWDTREKNIEDREKHGTTARGEKVASSVLTKEDVIEIRRLYIKGSRNNNMRALARRYNVSHGAIERVINGTYWKHI